MTGRILVVDDDPSIRALLKESFQTDGLSVETAHDGDVALQVYSTKPPDVVVVDYMMPGMNGIEVAEKLRASGYAGPIYLFSAYLSRELKEQAERLGIVPCSKVDLNSLFRMVRASLSEMTN